MKPRPGAFADAGRTAAIWIGSAGRRSGSDHRRFPGGPVAGCVPEAQSSASGGPAHSRCTFRTPAQGCLAGSFLLAIDCPAGPCPPRLSPRLSVHAASLGAVRDDWRQGAAVFQWRSIRCLRCRGHDHRASPFVRSRTSRRRKTGRPDGADGFTNRHACRFPAPRRGFRSPGEARPALQAAPPESGTCRSAWGSPCAPSPDGLPAPPVADPS